MKRFAVLAVLALLAIGASTSQAAFPGRNGPLSYLFPDPDGADVNGLQVISVTSAPVPNVFSRWECCSDYPGVTSADGERHAELGEWRGRDVIKVLDRPGHGRVISQPPRGYDDWEPEWSPSGTSLVFSRGKELSDSTVFRIGADGSRLRRLASGSEPVWGANKRIAYVAAGTRRGVTSVWTMRSDGSDRRRITRGVSDTKPEWSPDGRTIAFERDDDIYVVSARGGEPRLVSDGPSELFSPAFSPDGRRLAYAAWDDEENTGRIRIVQTSNPGRTLRVVRCVSAPARN